MSAVVQRKNEILRLLRSIENYPASSQFRHEMMTYAYILVCASIEFMVEDILREWLKKSVRHHDNSSNYVGKKYVASYLSMNSGRALSGIDDFHSTKLEKIRGLISEIAGDVAKNKFNALFGLATPVVLPPDINARLERINKTRHALAHGTKLPSDIQPNVSELREDFVFIYKHIVRNIADCLPRV